MTNDNIWIEKLKDWASENPIKNIETIKNDYKDFDGSIGLPDDEKEYLSIEKLILPLGDTYEKDIPKELASLPNLTELTIIARNVKEVTSEIFHIPTLKKLSITVDYDFQINEQDLKALIANGCQEIRVNTLDMNTQYKGNIKDNAILNYIAQHNLYITSQDFGIPKSDLYNIAKKIAFTDQDFSEYILGFLEEKYTLGYEAFIYAHNNDEKEIDNIISNIELDYETYEEVEKYVECILEVGISIVDVFPFKALEVLNNINETYSIIGSLPAETINLSVDIICSIAKQDVVKSLEYLNIIEVDHYKLESLEKIRLYTQSKGMVDKLDGMIADLKNIIKFNEAMNNVRTVAGKEEVLSLLTVAQVDSIKALYFFQKCNKEFYYQPKVIKRVISFLKEDTLSEALTIINNLQDDWTKQIALSDLAVHAQTYDLDLALQIANLCDSYYKPKTLKSIVSEVLKSNIEIANNIAQSIDTNSSKIGALAAIASYTQDEEAIDELIKIARIHQVCDYNDGICEILTNIASSIVSNFPHKAIELLKEIHCNKDIAIEIVALNLSDVDLAINLIKTSLNDDGIPWLSTALRDMALKIAKTDMQKALTLIDEIQDQEEKDEALFWLHMETWDKS